MIERLSHVTLYVLNQDEALDFYSTKLGFETRIDFRMDNGFRWLTVSPPLTNLTPRSSSRNSTPRTSPPTRRLPSNHFLHREN